jgi:hemerythrin
MPVFHLIAANKNKVLLMPIIEWSDSFLIGVEVFDEHHKHLVYLLNQAYDDFVAGASVSKNNPLLDELFAYAQYHFEAEEHMMCKLSYPAREQHMWEHTVFARQLYKIRRDYEENKTGTPLEILTFLKEWLASHILKSDADLGHYITFRKGTVS